MMQDGHTAAGGRKKTATGPGKGDGHMTPGSATQGFTAAVQFLQQGKFDKALAAFEKLEAEAPVEFRERSRMYATACRRQMQHLRRQFNTPEEHFDFAISRLNTGDYEEARDEFASILTAHPKADYVYYGLAVLEAILGRTQECLDCLARSIDLNPRNRVQARVDNDFQNMLDDPRFTELLYPE